MKKAYWIAIGAAFVWTTAGPLQCPAQSDFWTQALRRPQNLSLPGDRSTAPQAPIARFVAHLRLEADAKAPKADELPGSPTAAQRYVIGRTDLATNISPVGVAVGAFKKGSGPGLAVTNYNAASVSIILPNVNGTFQTHVDYATGADPNFVAVGDFNKDGNLDLAVTSYGDNTVSILLGNGDGTFQSHVDYATASNPQGVVVGDFNRDGKLDLAVSNNGSDSVSVLLGNGDGTFQPQVSYAAGIFPTVPATGDFNGEGILDLAVPNSDAGSVSVCSGTVTAHLRHKWNIQRGLGRFRL